MATDLIVNGLPFSAEGALQLTTSAVSASSVNSGGKKIDPSVQQVHVVTRGAGDAVPATAVTVGGIAYAQDGAMYVTESTTGSFSDIGPFRVRSDGALLVKDGTPVVATDIYSGAWAFDMATRGAFVSLGGGFAVLDSDGNSFNVTLAVLDSDGNSFTVSSAVLDSDGNSFSPI